MVIPQCFTYERESNLAESKKLSFVNDMITILSKKKCQTTRIHASGDFYSKDYIVKWYTIIYKMSGMKFYAYTKRLDLFDEKLLRDKPKNLTLINSLDGIHTSLTSLVVPKGFDKIAVVSQDRSTCPAQLKASVTCGVSCRLCIDSNKTKVIIFKKH